MSSEIPASSSEAALEKARAVAPILRAAGAEIEAARALTPGVLTAMHDAELFRLTLPARNNGAELPVPQLAQVAEIIAGADASAAWCLGQSFGCAMSAAFMDEGPAREVFGAREAVLAWGAGLQGKMVATDGGYLVSGTWRFASGSHHATWLGGHSKVFEADGSPR
ncbi:MAG: acyl-CoA dehydrogenase, partial [Rhodospirillaceae bacterium]|nr:acyl-CoA dehydrogenase [Rhodospirillaceae bacterium]